MTRTILRLIVPMTLVATVLLQAEPTPSADRNPNAKNQKPPAKTNAAPKSALAEGWNYVNGEWIHSDGYKYVNGTVTRIGTRTYKRPPKPPTKALLNSVKIKPAPTPVPGSAAAKAAEKERNLRTRPAPQTGSHL